ncbi:MAG TPA: hypothetical protein VGO50_14680 [Pyrinomonadaceae bacterium]|jgi:hypothetical protein|nr:hypothetical protein [Pyrinomonadaceae bacterium]
MKVEIIEIDGELGFIIPEEFHGKLRLDISSTKVGMIETPTGIELVPYIPELDNHLESNERN